MRGILTVWVVSALGGLAAGQPTPTAVELREACQVSGDWVLLGDIAQVSPPEAAAALACLPVAPAPPPGTTRTIALGYLKVRLRRERVDLGHTDFSGAEAVVVSRAAAPASSGPATITGVAESFGPAPVESSVGTAPPSTPLQLGRGTRLRLVVRCAGLTVEATGELLGPAQVGTVARLRVVETQSVVWARISGPTEAEVVR